MTAGGGHYAKLFGTLWRSGQLDGLPAATERLYYRALGFCADNLTDGHITRGDLYRLGGKAPQAAQLVERGLWLETDTGAAWTDATYALGQQRTRDQVDTKRYADRDRQAARRSRLSGGER